MPLRILLAVLSGIALSLAFEPLAIAALMPPAVAVFLWCVHRQPVRRGLALGLVFGVAFFPTHIWWMRAVGTDAWLALALFEALFLGLAGACLAAVSRVRLWPLASAVVWVAVEVFRGAWPMSGFTWGQLSFASIDTPFAAWLPWVGATGVSFLIALVSAGLLWLTLRVRAALAAPRSTAVLVVPAAVTAAAVLLVLAPGLVGPQWTGDQTARVAIVQGNVPGSGDNLLAHHRQVTENHMELTRELAADVAAGRVEKPDFVVWPENSTAVDPFRDLAVRSELEEVSAAVGVPILVGAVTDGPTDDYVLNQGIVYRPGVGGGERYTKRHPVPFGEYIPYRQQLGLGQVNFGRLSEITRDQMRGTRETPLRIDGLRVADVICFDVAYDDSIADQVRHDADLLVVQTSNAMFIHTDQVAQQFAISRVRARETGRSVVVAAVNGQSGVIGPDGQVDSRLPIRTRDTLVTELRLADGVPPSMWVGPWLGRGSVAAALAVLLLCFLAYRRSRNAPGRTAREEQAKYAGTGERT